MFSGIIESTARVVAAEDRGGVRRVSLALPRGWRVKLGQSVSVDGICSTVADASKNSFTLEYMPETLSKTTAGAFAKNRIVNLERSLSLQTLIDGHLVQGHVDTTARVSEIMAKGGAHTITVELPATVRKFVALHGSITINGVALTVATRGRSSCTVALIPHTLLHTNLGALKKGDRVNVETDLIARYLAALRRM